MTHNLKIEIDRDLCIGSGDCQRLAPEVFELDDRDIAVVLDPAGAEPETLRDAERACPTGAIQIIDP